MLRFRVIPVLLLQDMGLVKTKQFKKPVYVGDPINAVKIFNLKEVDELIFLDINASQKNSEPNYSLIADIASEAFMPFGYGGGVRTIQQIRNLLRIGVEKIIINSALSDRDFVRQAVDIFGSSTIVASIDIINRKGNNQIYSHKHKAAISNNVFDSVKTVEAMGVGEMMINSVDRDGMYTGYDIDILKTLSDIVDVPVIACGGASGINDIQALFDGTTCMAAAGGSMFVFYGKHKAVLITYPDESELKSL